MTRSMLAAAAIVSASVLVVAASGAAQSSILSANHIHDLLPQRVELAIQWVGVLKFRFSAEIERDVPVADATRGGGEEGR